MCSSYIRPVNLYQYRFHRIEHALLQVYNYMTKIIKLIKLNIFWLSLLQKSSINDHFMKA